MRLKLGAGALLYAAGWSSSAARPRWTADRVSSARIPHDDGPWSDPMRSIAKRANACTEEIEVDSMAWLRTCCFAARL